MHVLPGISCCLDCSSSPARSSQVTHLTLQLVINLPRATYSTPSIQTHQSWLASSLKYTDCPHWLTLELTHWISIPLWVKKSLNYWFAVIQARKINLSNFQIISMRGNKSRRPWSAVNKYQFVESIADLQVNILTCKVTFCCKYVQRTVLRAVQCICIHFIALYII